MLDDPRLHEFIGGHPLRLNELRGRYERQVTGWSPDREQRWLNWVVRELTDRQAIGVVQATVIASASLQADLAWTIAIDFQGCGYAQEAAGTIAAWLTEHDVEVLVAAIHPDHLASGRVAQAIGLRPTTETVAGEVRWSNQTPRCSRRRES